MDIRIIFVGAKSLPIVSLYWVIARDHHRYKKALKLLTWLPTTSDVI